MVKIINKFAIIGAVLAIIPVALPFITLDATVISTLENIIIQIYPWGLVSVNAVVIQDIIFLIQFMIPVIGAPIIAIFGSTKLVGGKTIIGVAGFLTLFGDFVWFMLFGPLIGNNTLDVSGIGEVTTIGNWSYGFFVAIVAGIVLFISVFLHPKAEKVQIDLDLMAPYHIDEGVYKQEGDKAEELKFCPYCGEKIPIQAEFCPKCGTNLTDKENTGTTEKEFKIDIEDDKEDKS